MSLEKPLAGSNPMLHFQIRTPSTGVRLPTTLFHGLIGVLLGIPLSGGDGDRETTAQTALNTLLASKKIETLANLVTTNQLSDILRRLTDGGTTWRQFSDAQRTLEEYTTKMKHLDLLELAEFSGDNFAGAIATERGFRVQKFLDLGRTSD